MNLRSMLEDRLCAALVRAGMPEGTPAMVMPSTRPEFGDYQVNGIMPAAKKHKSTPRQLAEKVAAAAELDDLVEKVKVAGPGFVNITLKADFLGHRVGEAMSDDRLSATRPAQRQTVVVDYSSPNLAKEMHVGHLRSTIIGDAMGRVLEFLGHKVIRQNHVGDWGTQFGMLVANLRESFFDLEIEDLEAYYVGAKKRFDTDPEFANHARAVVADMHCLGPRGKSDAVAQWQHFRQISLQHCYQVYSRLGICFADEEGRKEWQPKGLDQVPAVVAPPEQSGVDGESFYNDSLPNVVADLKAEGLLEESQGAKCVFLPEFKGKDGQPLPVIVQKSDGGYLYATTDLAAIRYRVDKLKADRILYVTDSRQGLHFRQVFAVGRKVGFAPENVSLEHVPFGTMMGADGRPFRTREGGTVKLMDLLDEAEQRARVLVEDKNPDFADEDKRRIARAVGIGAVKYADLAHNRNSDYVFSWKKMLALDGNTAPYMQYAYARIRSIFRKGREEMSGDSRTGDVFIEHQSERTLGLKLAQFPETIDIVAAESLPHLLCTYLFDLAGAFMVFYESCPVLQSEEPTRRSRLVLCDLTARTIKTALDLLGIEVLEQM